jgi:hypothetical protein
MEFNILVAHSFLRFFSEIFGDYPKFFKAKENDNPDAPPSTPRLHFHMKKFIRSKTSEVKRVRTLQYPFETGTNDCNSFWTSSKLCKCGKCSFMNERRWPNETIWVIVLYYGPAKPS